VVIGVLRVMHGVSVTGMKNVTLTRSVFICIHAFLRV
jgi:hypothetical protein